MKQSSDGTYNDLLLRIKKEGMSAMLPLYQEHRDKYLSFTSSYTRDRDLRLQSFHDAIVQTYKSIVNNTYDSKRSGLKTFIFNVGKNKLINQLEKLNNYNKYISSDDALGNEPIDETKSLNDESGDKIKWKQELSLAFESLGSKCRELILNFYYNRLYVDEIMEVMQYDSPNVVYSAKSRCLKKLRESITTTRERN